MMNHEVLNVFFSQGCPSGFEFNSEFEKCYFFSTTEKYTWATAENHCASLRDGAHLASIHSASEMNYLLSTPAESYALVLSTAADSPLAFRTALIRDECDRMRRKKGSAGEFGTREERLAWFFACP
ncbi:unnamed protein product [Cyprideis torosa]|uniref:Uncharacterized protein n=1 Tax=Cyprideis torosa TaxID=163714 RepID=A0A7R8WJP6_9CRUS|nr:unnamed protein product [Cyprideis torosa]CAG0902252.1 unnamed protein product [Cyprideis torosa]